VVLVAEPRALDVAVRRIGIGRLTRLRDRLGEEQIPQGQGAWRCDKHDRPGALVLVAAPERRWPSASALERRRHQPLL
jgi:hypothetical protein